MKTKKLLVKSNDKVTKILKWTSIVLLILFIVSFPMYFKRDYKRIFSDFAETLSYCIIKNPYTGEYSNIHSIYPPFAYLPFYLFALICKSPILYYLNGYPLSWLCQQPSFVLSFWLFYTICLVLVMFLAQKITGFKGQKLIYLLICIACFSPMAYCFYRGNNIIFALVFVMLFYWLYNSKKKWQREIANLCLACAIAVKIYPILLLLFFIKDRRFLDLCKTFIYSLLLLMIPFLLVDGGFGNLKHIWNNFTHFNSGQSREKNLTNISLDALAAKVSDLLNCVGLYSILSKILRFGLVATAIVTLSLSKQSRLKMQPFLLAVLTYELFMGVSYAYTLIFLIIPVLIFLKCFEEYSISDRIFYGVIFLIIACPIFAGIKNYTIPQLALITLAVKAVIDLLKEYITTRKVVQTENSIAKCS